MSSCLFALCLIGLRASHCGLPSPSAPASPADGGNDGKDAYPQECTGWKESHASILLIVVSVVFFIFTCCMFVEQLDAIKSNASKIARMKMRVGQAGTELSRVTEVRTNLWWMTLFQHGFTMDLFSNYQFLQQEFNEMFGGDSNQVAWHWFLPVAVEFPPGMKKVVLGYEWDETFDAVPYEEPSNGDLELGNASTVGSRIELTAARGRADASATLPTNKEKSSEHEGADDVLSDSEEAFTGTPVQTERPTLIKRSSRDHDTSSREQQLNKQGTLT